MVKEAVELDECRLQYSSGDSWLVRGKVDGGRHSKQDRLLVEYYTRDEERRWAERRLFLEACSNSFKRHLSKNSRQSKN